MRALRPSLEGLLLAVPFSDVIVFGGNGSGKGEGRNKRAPPLLRGTHTETIPFVPEAPRSRPGAPEVSRVTSLIKVR